VARVARMSQSAWSKGRSVKKPVTRLIPKEELASFGARMLSFSSIHQLLVLRRTR